MFEFDVSTTYVFSPASLSLSMSACRVTLSNQTPIGKYEGAVGSAFENWP